MTIKSYINQLEDRDIIRAYVACVIHQYEGKVGTKDPDEFLKLEYEDVSKHIDEICPWFEQDGYYFMDTYNM